MTHLYYAAYARISLNEQTKGISLEDQMSRIHEWIRHQSTSFELAQYGEQDGKEDYAEFYEEHTGFDYERPKMDVVRLLARRGLINAVVVLRTDRFARDEAVFMMLEKYFKDHGVRLFSVEDGEFTLGIMNRYVAVSQRVRVEDDAILTVRRMQQARQAYRKSGVPQSQGNALYGYYKEGYRRETQYIIDDEQSKIVRHIFFLYVKDNYTSNQIAAWLNDNNVPSPGAHRKMKDKDISGKWIDKTVIRILQNSAYIGELVGNQHISINGKVTLRDKEEQIIIPIPAIIEQNMWDLSQDKLLHARNLWFIRRQNKRSYLLTGGLVRCSKCGYSMTGSKVTKGTKKSYFYYRCSAEMKQLFMKLNCSNRIHVEDLEFAVWYFIERLLTDTEIMNVLYQQEICKEKYVLLEGYIESIDELLHDNKEQGQRLNWIYQKRRCDKDYFEAEYACLRARLGTIRYN